MSEESEPEPSDATDDLAAMLRRELLPEDDLLRDRHVRRALSVYDEQWDRQSKRGSSASANRQSTSPGRTASPGWLVAAAVLGVVAVGGYLLLGLDPGGTDSTGSDAAETAASALDSDSSGAAAADAEMQPTTSARLVELGSQPDESSMLAAAAARLGPVSTDLAMPNSTIPDSSVPSDTAARSPAEEPAQGAAGATGEVGSDTGNLDGNDLRLPSSDEQACVEQLAATGDWPVALGSIRGTPVIVTRRPGGYHLYRAIDCEPSP